MIKDLLDTEELMLISQLLLVIYLILSFSLSLSHCLPFSPSPFYFFSDFYNSFSNEKNTKRYENVFIIWNYLFKNIILQNIHIYDKQLIYLCWYKMGSDSSHDI